MFPRRQFRHHPAILAVNRELARNYRRQNARFVFDYGRGSFVAGTLDRKDSGHIGTCGFSRVLSHL
jgi:hypothetical protein